MKELQAAFAHNEYAARDRYASVRWRFKGQVLRVVLRDLLHVQLTRFGPATLDLRSERDGIRVGAGDTATFEGTVREFHAEYNRSGYRFEDVVIVSTP